MRLWMSVVVVLCAVAGCSAGTEPADPKSPQTVVPSPGTFAGEWRSVTPSLEFLRLSIHSTSSEQGVLGARLTFSGLAWDGSGRIEGDSFVANMTIAHVVGATRVMVVRAHDARTLRVQWGNTSGATTDWTFVRDD